MDNTDERYMNEALKEAMQAAEEDEVPVGAVVVCKGRIVGKGHNMTERLNDPTAHAEMIAITAATEAVGGKYLNECTLYVTVEPCPMCAWAILNARIPKVYFGAYDTVYGSLGTAMDLRDYMKSKTDVVGGILEEECSQLLKDYFKEIRK